MSTPQQPAHYLLFHPERKRTSVRVRASALVRGTLQPSWSGTVWVDRPPGNEDPYVFGPSWAYSYCHATQLRRARQPGPYVKPGSCILFCSGDMADREQVLCVDTVFWVGAAHRWVPKRTVPDRYTKDKTSQSDLWRFHLVFGEQPPGHVGSYTYEAALFSQPERPYSLLPLDARGRRVCVPIQALPGSLVDRIEGNLRGKYPVLVPHAELQQLLQTIAKSTEVEVVRDIVIDDPEFLALRQEFAVGCHPVKRTGSYC